MVQHIIWSSFAISIFYFYLRLIKPTEVTPVHKIMVI